MFLLHKLFSILFAHKKDVTAVAFFFIFLEDKANRKRGFKMREVLKSINGKPVKFLVGDVNEPNYEKIARSILRLSRKIKQPESEIGTA
ncbi:hypothetical protein CU084_04210 [Bacillus velezensis]|nr:hypothetical protein CU084_04210 [Bacillus velezensis]